MTISSDRDTTHVVDGQGSLSVVVPVYNSAECLPELARRLKSVLEARAREFELVLVNDASRDESGQVAARLARKCPWIRHIDLARNVGQHNALLCGIRAARYSVIVTLDDDLQNPPEDIGALLAKLDEGYDVVYGSPEHPQHGFLRNAASRITKLGLQRVLGAETACDVSPFRAFRADIRTGFADYRGPSVNIDVLLTWGASRFGSIPVRHHPRKSGTSNYRLPQLIRHAFDMLTGFSTVPLQVASVLGFVLTAFGCVLLLYVLTRYLLQGASVPGFAFLASVIIIFSGAQLFALGVIGEYLARMHFRMMNRPPYVVRTVTHTSAVGELSEKDVPNDEIPRAG